MCPSLRIKYSQIWRSLRRQEDTWRSSVMKPVNPTTNLVFSFVDQWMIGNFSSKITEILSVKFWFFGWIFFFLRFYLLWIEFYWGFGFVFGLFGNFGFKGWYVFGFCLQFKTKSRHFGWEGIVIGNVERADCEWQGGVGWCWRCCTGVLVPGFFFFFKIKNRVNESV